MIIEFKDSKQIKIRAKNRLIRAVKKSANMETKILSQESKNRN